MFLTFEQQNDLVARGLAKRSDNGNLSTFKYARKVMYDYLWDKHPELLECRGHTYNNTSGKLVLAAPRKTFNYLENGTWADKPLDTRVSAYKKFNGFMACSKLGSDGNLVVSTTGSTKSEYAILARAKIKKEPQYFSGTSLWEIVVPEDPHIVQEQASGAVFLGVRDNLTGEFWRAHDTQEYDVYTLPDAIELCKTNRGEGFMLYDEHGNCCKMKTEYYIGKKKLMRMPKSKVEQMWKNPKQTQDSLPTYWSGVVEYLLNTQDCLEWMEMTDQQRRKELERFI